MRKRAGGKTAWSRKIRRILSRRRDAWKIKLAGCLQSPACGVVSFVVVSALILLFFALRIFSPIQVILNPYTPLQGQTIKVVIESASSGMHSAKCIFQKRSYDFYAVPSSNSIRALIPVSLSAKPGLKDVEIVYERFFTKRVLKKEICILPRETDTIRLTLPRKTRRLYRHPDVPRARKKLQTVLAEKTPSQLWNGLFIIPVKGRFTSSYGQWRITPGGKYRHKGLDIAASRGTPVRAANDGITVVAERLPLQGKAVVINHGQGVFSTYYHLRSIDAVENRRVLKGEVVGKMGSSGISTGSHLHWGIFLHGFPVDSLDWTKRNF